MKKFSLSAGAYIISRYLKNLGSSFTGNFDLENLLKKLFENFLKFQAYFSLASILTITHRQAKKHGNSLLIACERLKYSTLS